MKLQDLTEAEMSQSGLIQKGSPEIVFLILMVGAGLIVGSVLRYSFITYCFFYAPRGRPINILLALEQVC